MEELFTWIKESSRIVFFTGAGASTDSGIPDFRSSTGLYRNESAEEILSGPYFRAHPDAFYRFYFDHLVFPDAKPNILHTTIAALERLGKVRAVITQNIDTLHQQAGSAVYCLHGTTAASTCVSCRKRYTLAEVLAFESTPRCSCGGVIRPDVVLFGEALDQNVMVKSAQAIAEADMLIVCGTSLVVNPAAALVQFYSGDRFVIINRDRTPYDRAADLVIRKPLSEVFSELKRKLQEGAL